MAKWLKITLISALVLIVSASIVLLCFQLFGFKGQSLKDLDINNQGKEQTIEEITKPISECTPKESLYVLSGKMNTFSYHATLAGQVTTSLGSLANQTISGQKFYQNGRALYITKSTSSMFNMAKKIYIEPNKTVNVFDAQNINDNTWKEEPTHFNTLEAYLQEYGTDFRNVSNYVLNDETITASKLVETDGNNYKYQYTIDPEKATIGYKINMAKMGNLASAPILSACTLTVVMNKNFQPVSVTMVDAYTVSYFGIAVTCTSSLTTTFDQIGNDIVFP